MEYLTDDSLLDIITHLKPQTHLNAFSCVTPWLTERINHVREIHSWKPGGQGRFAGTHQITAFQRSCLDEIFLNKRTFVPDYDNAIIVWRGLYNYLMSEHYSSFLRKNFPQEKRSILGKDVSIRIIANDDGSASESNNDYFIVISDYPLPVDEYTPLWVLGTSYGINVKEGTIQVFDGLGCLEIPLEKAVQIGGVKFQEKFPYLEFKNDIRYKDLAQYEIFLCSPGINIGRIASLLMQFSLTPKKLLISNAYGFTQQASVTLPAKKRFEYCTSVHTMEDNRIPFAVVKLPTTKRMNNAECCLAMCGYERQRPNDYIKWVAEVSGKTDIVIPTHLYMGPDSGSLWVLIDPNAQWSDSVTAISTKMLFYPEQAIAELQQLVDLREKISSSTKTTRGKTGTDVLTLTDTKVLCRKMGLSVKGNRQQLLTSLAVYLDIRIKQDEF